MTQPMCQAFDAGVSVNLTSNRERDTLVGDREHQRGRTTPTISPATTRWRRRRHVRLRGRRHTDFEDGDDLVNIHDLGHINADNFETNVTIRQSGDDVEVQIGDAVLTLTGVSTTDVTVDDFILA